MGDKIIKSRQSNFDLLRIISTISVVLIHVNATVANSNNISLVGFNICSLINIITRFSVPCFVMLSGAFILNNEKNADYKHFYAKSFYKIGIPLIIFSFLMLIISEVSAVLKGAGLAEPVLSLLKGNFNNYWFMFMLVWIIFSCTDNYKNKKYYKQKVLYNRFFCMAFCCDDFTINFYIFCIMGIWHYFFFCRLFLGR